jgi:hypothetical protein
VSWWMDEAYPKWHKRWYTHVDWSLICKDVFEEMLVCFMSNLLVSMKGSPGVWPLRDSLGLFGLKFAPIVRSKGMSYIENSVARKDSEARYLRNRLPQSSHLHKVYEKRLFLYIFHNIRYPNQPIEAIRR